MPIFDGCVQPERGDVQRWQSAMYEMLSEIVLWTMVKVKKKNHI